MADTTTRYSWPYQEATDAPNGPALGKDLAEAIETTVGAIDDRETAKNAVSTAGNGANTATFTTTTPSAHSPVVGTTFVAPPSGRVLVIGHVHVRNRTAGGASYGGVQVRTGGTLDAGTIIYNPSIEPNSKLAVQGFVGQVECTTSFTLTGLTPGATYNAVVCGWVDAVTTSGDLYVRRVDVVGL